MTASLSCTGDSLSIEISLEVCDDRSIRISSFSRDCWPLASEEIRVNGQMHWRRCACPEISLPALSLARRDF